MAQHLRLKPILQFKSNTIFDRQLDVNNVKLCVAPLIVVNWEICLLRWCPDQLAMKDIWISCCRCINNMICEVFSKPKTLPHDPLGFTENYIINWDVHIVVFMLIVRYVGCQLPGSNYGTLPMTNEYTGGTCIDLYCNIWLTSLRILYNLF